MRLLVETSRDWRNVRRVSPTGISPLNWFSPKSNAVKLVNKPKEVGMDPMK